MSRREISRSSNEHRYYLLDDFFSLPTVPSGRIELVDSGVPIHIFYADRDCDLTVVAFTGSPIPNSLPTPFWGDAWELTKNHTFNLAIIADPSIWLDSKLSQGFYLGNEKIPNLQENLARICEKMTDGRKSMFVGDGIAGNAACILAPNTESALVLASNLLDSFHDHAMWQPYLDACWPTLHAGAKPPVQLITPTAKVKKNSWKCLLDSKEGSQPNLAKVIPSAKNQAFTKNALQLVASCTDVLALYEMLIESSKNAEA